MLGYASPYWMTYRQAAQLGGQVRKGEKASIAIFYKAYGKKVEDATTGEQTTEARRVLRSYHVFNADQVDNLPPRFHVSPEPAASPVDNDRLAEMTRFFEKIPAITNHGGAQAYYSPAGDFIQLPPPEAFVDADRYGATRAHECCHWTGASHRLDRDFGKRFGDEKYAAEELVAELASAILGSEIGRPVDHLDDHASYIASWLSILKADPKALLTIAAKADEAATFLLQLAGGDGPPSTTGHWNPVPTTMTRRCGLIFRRPEQNGPIEELREARAAHLPLALPPVRLVGRLLDLGAAPVSNPIPPESLIGYGRGRETIACGTRRAGQQWQSRSSSSSTTRGTPPRCNACSIALQRSYPPNCRNMPTPLFMSMSKAIWADGPFRGAATSLNIDCRC
jgi:antirestriction protein ArdC